MVFVWGIFRWPVNSPHKGPVTQKMFHLMTSSWIWKTYTPKKWYHTLYCKIVSSKTAKWTWLRQVLVTGQTVQMPARSVQTMVMRTLSLRSFFRVTLSDPAIGDFVLWINTLGPRQNDHRFGDDVFQNVFSCMKMYEFWFKFHRSLFLRVQSTIFQHWFRWWLGADQATSHYPSQWCLDYQRVYA